MRSRDLIPSAGRLRLGHVSLSNKLLRAVWETVRLFLFRTSPPPFHGYRCLILRCFGARLGKGVHVYPSVRIWAPWQLEMGDGACLSPHVDCYNVGRVSIGANSTVSQYSFLCAATRDYKSGSMELLVGDIRLGQSVWVAADVFVGPGVSIGDSTVVLARSSVLKDLGPGLVARGTPAVGVEWASSAVPVCPELSG